MDKKSKLYAAYCSGLIDDNPRKACYPLVENALIDKGLDGFTDEDACRIVETEFGAPIDVGVVRQILQEGLVKGSLTIRNHKYHFKTIKNNRDELSQFDSKIDSLIESYKEFCSNNKFDCKHEDIRTRFIDALDSIDAEVISGNFSDMLSHGDGVDYSLYKFIEECSLYDADTFDFITRLCFSNLRIESIAYTPGGSNNLSNLVVYLDTPIVYALVGLSDDASNKLYPRMVGALRNLGCKVRILDRHWDEFYSGIHMTRLWAYGPNYKAYAANVCAQVMRKTWPSATQCEAELRLRLEQLTRSGIAVANVEYDRSEDRYQIDELALEKRIRNHYLALHKEEDLRTKQIEIDAVAISLVYRLRHGGVAYQVENARHLLMTPNSTLAKACKLFDREMRKISRQKFAIPACIHADLVASLLWVSNPAKFGQYKKERLLALCYQNSNPSNAVVLKFSKQLEAAIETKSITDDVYVFMKCAAVVRDSLLRVTNGDAAAVNDQIVKTVYDAIAGDAKGRFDEERASFTEQLNRKNEIIKDLESENRDKDKEKADLQAQIAGFQAKELKRQERNARMITIFLLVLASLIIGKILTKLGLHACFAYCVSITIFLFQIWRMGSKLSLIGRVRCCLVRQLSERKTEDKEGVV